MGAASKQLMTQSTPTSGLQIVQRVGRGRGTPERGRLSGFTTQMYVPRWATMVIRSDTNLTPAARGCGLNRAAAPSVFDLAHDRFRGTDGSYAPSPPTNTAGANGVKRADRRGRLLLKQSTCLDHC